MATTDVLRFVGIFSSAIHTGSQFSLSFVSGATLLAAPAVDESSLLSQFRVSFRRGFFLCPPFALVASLSNWGRAYLSWKANDTPTALRLLAAGVCTASLVPFTLLFVVKSEGALLEKGAEKPGEGKRGEPESAVQTRALIGEWARLNYVRTLFPLVGALLAYSAY